MMKLAIVDFETEMVGEYGDLFPQPVDIGVVLYDNGRLVDKRGWYIHSDRPLGPRPAGLDTLDRHAVFAAPKWPVIYHELQNFVPRGYTPAAWPASFEQPVFARACQQHIILDNSGFFARRWFCLMSAVQTCAELLGLEYKSASLENMWDVFGLGQLVKAHRGMQDATDEGTLFWHALQRAKDRK